MSTIKDSGEKRKFDSGAVRDKAESKGRYDLIPTRALARVAKHYEAGANKYGARNWEKGMPLHSFMDSAMRHLSKHLQGERDEDHLAAAAWNVLCHIETEERIKAGTLPTELDDLPK